MLNIAFEYESEFDQMHDFDTRIRIWSKPVSNSIEVYPNHIHS